MRFKLCVPLLNQCAGLMIIAGVLMHCGPVTSIHHILRADQAVTIAQRAGSDTYAPYESTHASEYLHKAREEQGYSDYEVAVRYAQRARDYADQALKLTRARQKVTGALPHPAAAKGSQP